MIYVSLFNDNTSIDPFQIDEILLDESVSTSDKEK